MVSVPATPTLGLASAHPTPPAATMPMAVAERAYRLYLARVAAILALTVALGVPATLRLAGEGGLVAMAAGAVVSLAASLVGSLPILRGYGRPMPAAMSTMMGSIAIRLAVVLFAGLAVALSGLVAPAPFLIWLAVAHAALLVADTAFALGSTRAATTPGEDAR